MKKRMHMPAPTAVRLAVQASLLALVALPGAVWADDAEVKALTQPTSTVEVGILANDSGSAKLGEYNGLTKAGNSALVNFNVRSGSGMDADGGVERWSLIGTDLGTTERAIRGQISNQGQWNFGLGYDQLRHYISDTYQTPYTGNMGDNLFTLPSSFGVINTAYVSPSFKIGTQVLSAAQLAAFTTTDVYTDRANTNVSAGYKFDNRWSVKFDFNHLDQTGAKLISSGTDSGKYGTFAAGAEKNVMLMNPTNYQTDTINLAVNWNGEKGHFSVAYFGSYFQDAYDGLSWSNPFLQSGSGASATTPLNGTVYAAAFPVNTLSTAPSNDLHQFNLTGGYNASSSLRMAGGLSYSRNTQDDPYPAAVMQAGGLPQTSLGGLVITTHADFRITDQATHDLQLSAGVKYNERDNQTPAATYKFLDLGGGAVSSVNAPMSNRKTQLELAGDLRVTEDQKLRLAYTFEDVQRWCNQNLSNTAVGALPSGYAANFPTVPWTNTSCAQIPKAQENKLAADYRVRAGDDANLNLGYSFANRSADVNPTFYNPMQAESAGYELLGYRAFFDASRREQILKAGANLQATAEINLGITGRVLLDQYTDSPLGVQNGRTSFVNLDMAYAMNEKTSFTAYLSGQDRERDLISGNGLLVPGTPAKSAIYTPADKLWTNQLKDVGTTIGLAYTRKDLLQGRLDLNVDWSYSMGTTGYTTGVGYSIATTAIPTLTCSDTQNLTCGNTPDIKNETINLKISGLYTVDKSNKVRVTYLYQKLSSADYYYNAYQNGYTPSGLLATNEQAPNLVDNIVAISYIHSF